MKTVTFHSFKGGTGKTSLSVNFAWYLAIKGYNTCLIDFDLRAPSLHAYFPTSDSNRIAYFTDFLLDYCRLEEIFYPIVVKAPNDSNFWISYTSFEFIKQESEQRRKLSQKDTPVLPKLFQILKYLENNGFDYLIIDNMPGVSYRAIDALIAASHIVCVTRPSTSDVVGLEQLATNIYSRLSEDARIGLIINQKEERTENVRHDLMKTRDLEEDLHLQEKIYSQLHEVIMRINSMFEFQVIATIPRIPFLVERIYVPEKIDQALNDVRIKPFMEALEKLKQWSEEG